MKHCRLILTYVFSLVCVVAMVGCRHNVNTMLKDYNGHYIYTQDDIVYPVPGDIDFDASMMLLDYYIISDKLTLNILAPDNCSEYKWVIRNPYIKNEENPNGIPVDFQSKTGSNSQRLVLFVPESNLQLGVYELELTVKDSKSESFSDVCKLIIYQHY